MPDTPLRTTKNKKIDHLSTSIITNIGIKPSEKISQKEIYDKSTYQKARFQNSVQSANWGHFYSQTCAEGMFTVLNNVIENALKMCIHRKKDFIRIDKSSLTIFQRWVDAKSQKLHRLIKYYKDSLGQSYKELHRRFLENLHSDRLSTHIKHFGSLKTERAKWNFINEARNSRRTKTSISFLRNSFGDLISEQKDIPNLFNYMFSRLGDFMGKTVEYTEHNDIKTNEFRFEPIGLYQCKSHGKSCKSLNINKPLGPSNIPAWALKDCLHVIAEPPTFLINALLNEGNFASHLKQAHVIQVFKSGDAEDPQNYGPISITSALSKVFEKVINEQITQFLDQNQMFSPLQFGFRSKFSTTDALLFATEKKEI